MKKHEWRKAEKEIYLPKTKPQFISIPEYNFLSISGEGNPNSQIFSDHIGALYACSYAIKMGLKSKPISDHVDYTVYPLEGVWDLNEEGRKSFSGKINKDQLVYTLMIRQPNFINEAMAIEYIEKAFIKKGDVLIKEVKFIKHQEGPSVQMLHVGSYESEKKSFGIMEEFAFKNGWERSSMIHREIYLSDFRKIEEAKLKTVLRFQLKN